MLVRKTVKIPIHYKATDAKIQKLDRLTARLTYCITLINSLVTKDTKLGVKALQRLVDDNGIAGKAKLSTGYVQQCRDKVLWSWRSYKVLHDDWKYSFDDATEELGSCGDDEREKLERKVERLEKREPSPPSFLHKTSCRLDHRTGKTKKLKQLRNKRGNVSVYHDFCLARQVADLTEGCYMAIGNMHFRQMQYRGNGMSRLRKRIGKWPYSRQRELITLRRAERGYATLLVDERYTSRKCCRCGSMLTRRKWELGSSYTLCHGCQEKVDADIAGATNIAYKAREALRCRDERLKVQMNAVESGASA